MTKIQEWEVLFETWLPNLPGYECMEPGDYQTLKVAFCAGWVAAQSGSIDDCPTSVDEL